jgi:hypothetical protein
MGTDVCVGPAVLVVGGSVCVTTVSLVGIVDANAVGTAVAGPQALSSNNSAPADSQKYKEDCLRLWNLFFGINMSVSVPGKVV